MKVPQSRMGEGFRIEKGIGGPGGTEISRFRLLVTVIPPEQNVGPAKEKDQLALKVVSLRLEESYGGKSRHVGDDI